MEVNQLQIAERIHRKRQKYRNKNTDTVSRATQRATAEGIDFQSRIYDRRQGVQVFCGRSHFLFLGHRNSADKRNVHTRGQWPRARLWRGLSKILGINAKWMEKGGISEVGRYQWGRWPRVRSWGRNSA